MIVYGTFTETSVSKLFMAGVIPGLMLTGLFMGYIDDPCAAQAGDRAARDRAATHRRARRGAR